MKQHKSIVLFLPEILDFWLQVATKFHLHDFLHGFVVCNKRIFISYS